MEEGERITPQDKFFTTFESTEVFAAFPVPERDALRIAPDQMVQINVPALMRKYNSILVSILIIPKRLKMLI